MPKALSKKKTTSQKLNRAIKKRLKEHLANLDGTEPANLYNLLVEQVEKPLFKTVLKHCDNNQSKAAKCLGISRSTLRKKQAKLNL